MKQIFSLLICIGLSSSGFLKAQEPAPVPAANSPADKPQNGGLAFINAVPLDTPTEILVNGRSLRPAGFAKGRVTSFLILPTSTTSVVCKNGVIPARSEPLSVTPKASSIVVAYLLETVIPAKDSKPEEKKQELRALVVPCLAGEGSYNQRIVLVGSEKPVTFNINGKEVVLNPNQPSEPVKSSSVKIETLEKVAVGEFKWGDGGNFLVVVTPDLKGGYFSTGIRDELVTNPE